MLTVLIMRSCSFTLQTRQEAEDGKGGGGASAARGISFFARAWSADAPPTATRAQTTFTHHTLLPAHCAPPHHQPHSGTRRWRTG